MTAVQLHSLTCILWPSDLGGFLLGRSPGTTESEISVSGAYSLTRPNDAANGFLWTEIVDDPPDHYRCIVPEITRLT